MPLEAQQRDAFASLSSDASDAPSKRSQVGGYERNHTGLEPRALLDLWELDLALGTLTPRPQRGDIEVVETGPERGDLPGPGSFSKRSRRQALWSADEEARAPKQHKSKHHGRHARDNNDEERRRQWEEQERRRVDEERRRANDPREESRSSAERERYEARLREWQRRKEERDRLIRERERGEPQPATVRPLIRTTTESDEENERKLQDYIRRNTPINVSNRTPAPHVVHRPLAAHSRGPVVQAPAPPPERVQPDVPDHPEDVRLVQSYQKILQDDLERIHGPKRLEYEAVIKTRIEEYRQRLREERLRDYTGDCTNSSVPADISEEHRRQQLEDHRRRYEEMRRGQQSVYQTKGPTPNDDRVYEAMRRAQEYRSQQNKGPQQADPRALEEFRRAQESRYQQNKGPQPPDNRALEQFRRAEEYRRQQNKGPQPPDERALEEFRRAQESRYQQNKGRQQPDGRDLEEFRRAQASRYQQNKGPQQPDGRDLEEFRRAQESRYQQNKGPSGPPDNRAYEEMRRAQESRYQNKGPSPVDDRNLEEFRRGQESRSQSKGGVTPEPMSPEVWQRVYESRYRTTTAPNSQGTDLPNHHQRRPDNRVRPTTLTPGVWSGEQLSPRERYENRVRPTTVTPTPWSGEQQTELQPDATAADSDGDDRRSQPSRGDISDLPTTTTTSYPTVTEERRRRPPSRYGSYPGQYRHTRPEVDDRR